MPLQNGEPIPSAITHQGTRQIQMRMHAGNGHMASAVWASVWPAGKINYYLLRSLGLNGGNDVHHATATATVSATAMARERFQGHGQLAAPRTSAA